MDKKFSKIKVFILIFLMLVIAIGCFVNNFLKLCIRPSVWDSDWECGFFNSIELYSLCFWYIFFFICGISLHLIFKAYKIFKKLKGKNKNHE